MRGGAQETRGAARWGRGERGGPTALYGLRAPARLEQALNAELGDLEARAVATATAGRTALVALPNRCGAEAVQDGARLHEE